MVSLFEQDLDLRCEDLIQEEFGVQCNFDVHDAVQKLERLGIVQRVSLHVNYYLFNMLHKYVKDQSKLCCNSFLAQIASTYAPTQMRIIQYTLQYFAGVICIFHKFKI
jgi:hypothetical protein